MDEGEQIASKYLRHLGFENIIHEPDGNVTPDFLVNNRIAVEVRRLNQNEIIDSGHRGLEVTAIPLMMKFNKLLSSLGTGGPGQSWFVRYTFARPLPRWARLQKAMREQLTAFQRCQHTQNQDTIVIEEYFRLQLIRASRP